MKDKASLLGVLAAFGVIFTSQILEGGSPASLFLLPPLLLVFGATLAVTVAGGTMADLKGAIAGLKRAFTGGVEPADEVVDTLVSLADKARREGLLALEDSLSKVENEFLVKGVTLAVDGTDPEEIRDILESEVAAKKSADKQVAKFFGDAGAYAPTIGIIGTVMGLVHVLENLASPEELGHLIAAAFLATLWGVLSANVLWLPISSKLKRLSALETAQMEMIIEGVWGICEGSNPRLMAAKLKALMPDDKKGKKEAA